MSEWVRIQGGFKKTFADGTTAYHDGCVGIAEESPAIPVQKWRP